MIALVETLFGAILFLPAIALMLAVVNLLRLVEAETWVG